MSWLIIWLIVCVTAGTLILVIRHIRKKRTTVAGSGGREAGEPTSPFWTWVERCGWCFGIVSGIAAVWTLVTSASPGSSPAKTPSPDPSSVVASSDGYPLEPCSWTLVCNDRDKMDLDTGNPGHGSSSIQVGPARNGGPAEIILEDDRIHGSDTTPRYVISPGTTADAADCVNLLAHKKYRRLEVGLDDLTQGTKLCVETNDKQVALVTVMRVSYDPVGLEIAFTTWKV
ncbi:hypothetical protein [Nonomuraea sp. SYSU D8015]|uniref:hypothetical protein n=1 Tax=Nonomuraea sp. SYSU D8015 TaxID=2593644 RepID=UPI001660A85B|nr:hypothetical protein [Nonomuraea sp. SYSU D8015]